MTLTKPQERALLWLPADGSWRGDADASVSSALKSLRSYHPDLVDAEWQTTRRGRQFKAYRLTPAGIAERLRREAAK